MPRIWPVWPFDTASGLIIAKVCWLGMALKTALNFLSDFRWTGAHRNSGLCHGLHLVFCFSRSAGDDRTRVTHATAGRSRLSGDETHHWLLDVLPNVFGRRFLGIAADFTDHHNGARVRVIIE